MGLDEKGKEIKQKTKTKNPIGTDNSMAITRGTGG